MRELPATRDSMAIPR